MSNRTSNKLTLVTVFTIIAVIALIGVFVISRGDDEQSSALDDIAPVGDSARADEYGEADGYCETVERPKEVAVIYFESETSNALTEPSQEIALAYIDYLKCNQPEATATVTGYTADVGDPAGEQALSDKRAQLVETYIVDQGVDPGQLTVVGRAAADPVGTNETDEGRALNRRVELKIQ